MGFKRLKLVSFRGGEKKREGGGEEKRKKKKMEEPRSSQQGMELGFLVWKLNLCMDSMRLCMNFHALMVILLPKSRVFVRVSS